MDEAALEAAIAASRMQLEQVEAAVAALRAASGDGGAPAGQVGGSPDSREGDTSMQVLLELRAGVQEFLELTEASLLAARKSSLLALLEETRCGEEGSSEVTHAGEMSGRVMGVKGHESNSVPGDEVNGQDEVPCRAEEAMDGDSLCGMKCLVPYRNSRGVLQYHRAMVSGPAKGPEEVDAVCVLFLFPTDRSLKPCNFYLQGRCRFDECCRFNHGVVVPCNQLREFEEPDIASLRTGDMCLARHDDDVWYAGTITDMADGYYTVKFDSLLLKERVVEADGLIPIPRTETEETSSSSEDSDGGEGAGHRKAESVHLLHEETDYDIADSGYVKLVECADKSPPLLGLWEVHTRGVGSRLLAKMGYQEGQGLGRKSDGRILPVDVVVLPAGRSLDSCAAILQHHRETGEMTAGRTVAGSQQPHSKRRKARHPAGSAGQSSYSRQKCANVFEFLNQKLGGVEKSAKFANDEMTDKFERLVHRGSAAYRGDAAWHRELGVLASQTAERVSQKQREVGRLKKALSRNAGRDAVIAAKLETRLGESVQSLNELQAQERKLQQKRERAETHRSMTQF
uniref:zinc finger CCCH-type with G patch domain-containing protein isoform X2 n=1 Tax=Myxine glutinosa TaxID=7769 RepID=UPI00358F5C8D